MLNRYEITLTIRLLAVFACMLGASYCLLHQQYNWLVVLSIALVVQTITLIRFMNKTNFELSQFLMAVQYRDFSQSFSEKQAPISVRQARRAFNVISQTFKQLASEKEMQYQYLQRILELVDTGILSYNDAGEIGWMNESLKRILNLPYLKSIHALERRDETLYYALMNLEVGKSELVTINSKQVLMAATAFQLEGEVLHLIAFQNVNQAINDTENQAYQRLLRVMTHEIMNSVAPIASLADTMQVRVKDLTEATIHDSQFTTHNAEAIEDIRLGIETIKKRSEGLLKFSDTYRNLAKVSKATFSKVLVRDIFENVEMLMENTLDEKGIELDVILKDLNLSFEADQTLIEQILINLLTNAIDAVKKIENPKIRLTAYNNDERPTIEIRDNGTGIPPEMLEQIFVPFFTTKKHGSGIGLSLSKQIMALHRGSIQVHSIEGEGTLFRLVF